MQRGPSILQLGTSAKDLWRDESWHILVGKQKMTPVGATYMAAVEKEA